MYNDFDAERVKKAAAEKLGMSPDELTRSGAEGILSRLSPADRERLVSLLSDQNAASRLLSSKEAARALKKFMKPDGR